MKRILIALLLIACLLMTVGCSGDGTPDGMQNVALEGVKYNLYVPDNWVALTYNVSGARATVEENGPNVIVTEHYPDGSVTPEGYWNEYCIPEYTATLTGFTIAESGLSLTLGGKDAKGYKFTYTFGDTQYKCYQIVTVFDYNVFVLTYTAVAAEYDTYAASVDEIVSAFTFK